MQAATLVTNCGTV